MSEKPLQLETVYAAELDETQIKELGLNTEQTPWIRGNGVDGAVNLAVHLSPEHLARCIVTDANLGDDLAVYWVSRLQRYGYSKGLSRDIYEALKDIRVVSRFELDDKTGFVELSYGDISAEQFPHIEAVFAFIVTRICNAGLHKRLKRCPLKRCRKYFFGDPRSRWCSDTCGTYYRVNKERHGLHRAKRLMA